MVEEGRPVEDEDEDDEVDQRSWNFERLEEVSWVPKAFDLDCYWDGIGDSLGRGHGISSLDA